MAKVDVEYCGYCDFESQCENLAKFVKELNPQTEVNCQRGRKGAFEIKVNDTLVYSKLSTKNFPNFKDVAKVVQDAYDGKPITPVTDSACPLM